MTIDLAVVHDVAGRDESPRRGRVEGGGASPRPADEDGAVTSSGHSPSDLTRSLPNRLRPSTASARTDGSTSSSSNDRRGRRSSRGRHRRTFAGDVDTRTTGSGPRRRARPRSERRQTSATTTRRNVRSVPATIAASRSRVTERSADQKPTIGTTGRVAVPSGGGRGRDGVAVAVGEAPGSRSRAAEEGPAAGAVANEATADRSGADDGGPDRSVTPSRRPADSPG